MKNMEATGERNPKAGGAKLTLTEKGGPKRLVFLILLLVGVLVLLLGALIWGAWRLAGKREELWQKSPTVVEPKKEEEVEQVSKFLFEPGDLKLEKGKTGEISLLITWGRKFDLDGMDVVLKFDPEKLEIVGVEPTKIFSFVNPRVDKEKGRVILTLLETQKDKVEVKEATFLVKLTVKGKTPGETLLSVVSSQEDKVHTVLVESGSSRPLPFRSDSAKILVVGSLR